MQGAPHRLTLWPVHCDRAEEGAAGEYCPRFELRWRYKSDPQGRMCHEHSNETDEDRNGVARELTRERNRLSQEMSIQSDRTRQQYIQRRNTLEGQQHQDRQYAPGETRQRGYTLSRGTIVRTGPSDNAHESEYDRRRHQQQVLHGRSSLRRPSRLVDDDEDEEDDEDDEDEEDEAAEYDYPRRRPRGNASPDAYAARDKRPVARRESPDDYPPKPWACRPVGGARR